MNDHIETSTMSMEKPKLVSPSLKSGRQTISNSKFRCRRTVHVHWKDECAGDLDLEEHDRIDTSSVEEAIDEESSSSSGSDSNRDHRNMGMKVKSGPLFEKEDEQHPPKWNNSCNSKAATPTKKKAAPSTPGSRRTRLSRRALEQLVRKQQEAIHHACELELELLNNSAAVRAKRMRMVQRLQRMQRKLNTSKNNSGGGADSSSNDINSFVLPPVYRGGGGRASTTTTFSRSILPKQSAATESKVIDMTCSSDESTAGVPAEQE